MDCVEDTQLAIDYFVKSEFPEAEGENFIFNYGGQYIFIYGLLQALFLQQNALMDIAEVLNFGLKFEKNGTYSELYEIREIRNKVAGHPTKRKHREEWKSTHSIVRTSMTKESFEIRSKYKEQKESEFEEINTLKYISVQEEKVKEIINNLISQMKKLDKEIKMKFANDKMSDLFRDPQINNYFDWLIYYFAEENIGSISQAKIAIRNINKIYQNFKNKYVERFHKRKEIEERDIESLINIFENWFDKNLHIEKKVMYFLTKQLKIEFYKLKETAENIDNEFLLKD